VTITRDDVVLGLAFLLAFPVAITLTAWAAPEPTPPMESVEPVEPVVPDSGTR
jgi:hypothetical protein